MACDCVQRVLTALHQQDAGLFAAVYLLDGVGNQPVQQDLPLLQERHSQLFDSGSPDFPSQQVLQGPDQQLVSMLQPLTCMSVHLRGHTRDTLIGVSTVCLHVLLHTLLSMGCSSVCVQHGCLSLRSSQVGHKQRISPCSEGRAASCFMWLSVQRVDLTGVAT